MPRSLRHALLALLLAACSEGDGPTDRTAERAAVVQRRASAAAVVRAAPDRAAAAGSGRVAISVTFPSPDGPLELRSSGAFGGGRTTMSTDLASLLSTLPQGRAGPLPEGFAGPSQAILDGATVYVRMPLLEPLTGTSGWLSAAAGAPVLEHVVTIDPLRVLAILRGVDADVTEAGRARVRGVDTTRYQATVEDLPVELWIDRAGRPRRLHVPLPDTGRELGADGPARMAVEVFDYGEPIEIPVPRPEEVTPLAEVVPG